MPLLEPWLGQGLAANELRLPRLITCASIRRESSIIPRWPSAWRRSRPGRGSTTIAGWLDRLFDIALAIELVAAAIVARSPARRS